MTKSIFTTALSVAAAALITSTTFATTAHAGTVKLATAGVDLGTAAGKAEMDKRITTAALAYCHLQRAEGSSANATDCRNGVREELNEKVAAIANGTRMAVAH